ncbi:uncharacterized protein LOC128201253 [Galleria mellonella]|uniref:Uncharacterized protein LOC128201253 n=1 Tax=Galleria mellonella TaxID=7137 RepID=A0ABM3MQT1_GALME|nr:uncharacterized protein LOC128201253 [Galleria mellonella]
MGKCSDILPKKRSEIKTLLYHTNHSQRKIAELAGVSQSTVRNIKRVTDENKSLSPKRAGKCGRKRLTTPRTEREIRRVTIENRRKPRKVIKALLDDAGVTLSDRTLRRRLKELNFNCCRPLKKPKLTKTMRAKRLAFAKMYKLDCERLGEGLLFR